MEKPLPPHLDSPRPRRRLLVYPRFQLLMIAVNFGILLFSFGCVALQTYFSMSYLKAKGQEANLPPGHSYYDFLEIQSSLLLENLGVALLIGFVFSAFVTLVFTHRVTGPILKLKAHLEEVGKGKPFRTLVFRRGDFFREIPPAINQAMERLEVSQKGQKADPSSSQVTSKVASKVAPLKRTG